MKKKFPRIEKEKINNNKTMKWFVVNRRKISIIVVILLVFSLLPLGITKRTVEVKANAVVTMPGLSNAISLVDLLVSLACGKEIADCVQPKNVMLQTYEDGEAYATALYPRDNALCRGFSDEEYNMFVQNIALQFTLADDDAQIVLPRVTQDVWDAWSKYGSDGALANATAPNGGIYVDYGVIVGALSEAIIRMQRTNPSPSPSASASPEPTMTTEEVGNAIEDYGQFAMTDEELGQLLKSAYFLELYRCLMKAFSQEKQNEMKNIENSIYDMYLFSNFMEKYLLYFVYDGMGFNWFGNYKFSVCSGHYSLADKQYHYLSGCENLDKFI